MLNIESHFMLLDFIADTKMKENIIVNLIHSNNLMALEIINMECR